MLKNLRVIIAGQSMIIESISETFNRIAEYVEQSTDDLEEAKENAIGIQEKMCCILFFFIIISVLSMNWVLNSLFFGK